MSIKNEETYTEKDFLKVKIDPKNYTVNNSSSTPKEDDLLNKTEDMRVKEQMAIELKKIDVHKTGGTTLCNLT